LNYFDTVTRQQPDCCLVDVLAEDLLGTSAQKRNPTARPVDGRAGNLRVGLLRLNDDESSIIAASCVPPGRLANHFLIGLLTVATRKANLSRPETAAPSPTCLEATLSGRGRV